ncbi:MAG TPA: response regulator [Rhodanobacteraceae bacterium]
MQLQAAFDRHLPQRLRALQQRVRAQCRDGWDGAVLQALHDEIALLARACERYGKPQTRVRLAALQSALGAPLAAHTVPDGVASAAIDALLGAVQAAPDPAGDAPGPTPGGSVAEPAPGPRVVVVDDDDPVVAQLLLQLEQQGCDVATVQRVAGLVDAMRTAAPDLAVVVADAATPFAALAQALHAQHGAGDRRMRLLVLLRQSTLDQQLRALRAGADRCVALAETPAAIVGAALELAGIEHASGFRVLIVDDDAAQALFAQAILRHAGMETRILGEALAVLDELDRFRPDLLLLDFNLPGCDGFELTQRIRAREAYAEMPIVFLSGELDPERRFDALDAGADDFLIKPIRPTHLVAAVTSRVQRTRAAAARRRRVLRGDADALREHSQLLESVSAHVAATRGCASRGGLLAIELRTAGAVRRQLGQTSFEALLVEVGRFIARHVRNAGSVARRADAGYVLFAPDGNERALVKLAEVLADAVRDERFGAAATAVRFVFAVCALDTVAGASADVLAAVERTLAVARGNPDHIATHHVAEAGPPPALADKVARALAEGTFELAFQPAVPVRAHAQAYHQALLRLRVDGRDYVAAELVPVATRAGSIGAVDAWVVCRCVAIIAERSGRGDPVRLLASQSLEGWRDAARVTALATALHDAAVAPGALSVEFGAAAVASDPDGFARLALALRSAGTGIALAGVDDRVVAADWFRRAPPDAVKLQPGLDDGALQRVVSAAHGLGCVVVAARVETAPAAARLRAARVDLLQGNYLRPPARGFDARLPQAET